MYMAPAIGSVTSPLKLLNDTRRIFFLAILVRGGSQKPDANICPPRSQVLNQVSKLHWHTDAALLSGGQHDFGPNRLSCSSMATANRYGHSLHTS